MKRNNGSEANVYKILNLRNPSDKAKLKKFETRIVEAFITKTLEDIHRAVTLQKGVMKYKIFNTTVL